MDKDDFWSGLRLVLTGLADAARKASYSLGFGAEGLGSALWAVNQLGINGPPALLIPMSAFFIRARVGKALDDRLDRVAQALKVDDFLKLEKRIRLGLLPEGYRHDLDYYLRDLREHYRELERLQQEYRQLIKEEPEKLRREILRQTKERWKEFDELLDKIRNQVKDQSPQNKLTLK